jgi:hypothetical protein
VAEDTTSEGEVQAEAEAEAPPATNQRRREGGDARFGGGMGSRDVSRFDSGSWTIQGGFQATVAARPGRPTR